MTRVISEDFRRAINMKVTHGPQSAHTSLNTAETQRFYHSERAVQEPRRWADVPGGDGSLSGAELRQIRAEALQFPSGAIHGDRGGTRYTNQSRGSGGGRLLVEHYTSVGTGTQLPATPTELDFHVFLHFIFTHEAEMLTFLYFISSWFSKKCSKVSNTLI